VSTREISLFMRATGRRRSRRKNKAPNRADAAHDIVELGLPEALSADDKAATSHAPPLNFRE